MTIKKYMTVLSVFITLYFNNLKADEGMWMLPLIQRLNIDTMQSLGFKLSAEDIYSINQNCLKDAVVIFGEGCTGEIVSEEGLLLTNHHCGYDAIQEHSTVEHNYLEDGFWAMTRKDELPNKDLTVTFLIRIEDVTDLILKNIPDTMDESDRNDKISAVSDSVIAAAVKDTHYTASVETFYGGNNYYLFVYEIFNDVRLVGAPPSSIGKFGYDTDNWMWPRHTGDFSVFRVYSGADGKPADYDVNNIPLKPRYALPVSLKNKNADDFTMILGYPGSTDRYMSSFEAKELMEITNPNQIKIRGLRQEILMKDMLADEKVNIQYASKYSTSSNYWKYAIGQNQGLKKLHVLELKEQKERDFTNWVNEDNGRKQKYGNALDLIHEAIEQRAPYTHSLQYMIECFFSASEIIAFSNRAVLLYYALVTEPKNQKLIDSLSTALKTRFVNFYKDYNVATDMKVFPAMLELYKNNVPETFHPAFYKIIKEKYKNSYTKYSDDLFTRSIFTDRQRFDDFMKHPGAKTLEKDPAFQASLMVLDVYRSAYMQNRSADDKFERGHRLYIEGLKEMNQDKIYYPDANFTMRMTYGTIQDYYPRDAVYYNYFTTLDGIIEKEDPDNWEFVVPAKLKDLYESKDYGPYGFNDKMPVCFISNNDITGGNSGSPVMDGEGNLIGLAFDGNWEAMSGDIIFEPALQRCICVDIRYVLFIMDKFAGAAHLVNEMKIVR
jgi:hypothetical protein